MTKEEFMKLQIGLYIIDHEDVMEPANYCRIEEFGPNGQMRLQPYERYNQPTNAHPFWVDYHEVNITQKLFNSEYYSLSRR